MMIVTRPSPYGEELVQLLEQAGIPALHFPLFTIETGAELSELSDKLSQLQEGDLVIAVSPQVINAIATLRIQLTFPTNLTYLAIGEKTAKLFETLTKTPVIYPKKDENSEALLALRSLRKVTNKRILILRGNHGRELLSSILSSRGADVSYCECYRRAPVDRDDYDFSGWENNTTIIITNIETLIRLDLLITSKQRLLCQLIVSSPRIANKAKQLGWHRIMLADSANNQILFKTITTVCHNVSN
ncbi:uroporphyrinogen-III synthase [Zophobihabitans entericus]|uniref:Uroporphyrinogen-III synthase n=1 Tax=Zophobihabitans entericus TaxID=1635327 RepID=A0A6G9IAL0_9GAMM|nr:uroporphyrinogen-III synthase [Zophobihabitans entericus]QIQ21253.1 uroporphyrinogen-III synthase [Zophobihabitans entericus]